VHREEIYLRIAAQGHANHASAPPIAQKR
jgi:sRNA-binding carbon storage regulator CsrA